MYALVFQNQNVLFSQFQPHKIDFNSEHPLSKYRGKFITKTGKSWASQYRLYQTHLFCALWSLSHVDVSKFTLYKRWSEEGTKQNTSNDVRVSIFLTEVTWSKPYWISHQMYTNSVFIKHCSAISREGSFSMQLISIHQSANKWRGLLLCCKVKWT